MTPPENRTNDDGWDRILPDGLSETERYRLLADERRRTIVLDAPGTSLSIPETTNSD